MIDEVRICGRKLFHPHMWRILINGKKWLYDHTHDCFIEKVDGQVVAKKDMPLPVQLGFRFTWERNKSVLYSRYSRRHSYGWKLLIGNLQSEGDDVVVCSRGRRMGYIQADPPKNPLTDIPIAPVLV